jgi:uncharacterized damage-inducible protein DinB
MNPYASYLGSQDALHVIAETPGRLAELLKKTKEADRKPAPDKWSVREVLSHLADCEIVFAFRIRQTLAEPNHTIQPFDQDLWAKTYATYSAEEALRVFTTVREWNVMLIRSLEPEAREKPVTHPERGPMTLGMIFETMGGHDINHVAQLERLAV